jgi:tetratricopeptide (TPR) repeat protein
METFRKAIRENPTDTRALTGLALAYQRMGRLDLSRKWLETALATAPDSPQLLNDLADVLDQQGDRDQAALVRAEASVNTKLIASATARAEAKNATRAVVTKPSSTATVTLPAPAPADLGLTARISQTAAAEQPAQALKGPRLERLSLGEVALITSGRPVWASIDNGGGQQLALRFVPLQPAARLLNAARVEGLAARTREALLGKGWRKIEIGNAPAVRERTLVLYPSQERAKAERLVAQLGVGTVQPSFAGRITVLLGRDIARTTTRRPV